MNLRQHYPLPNGFATLITLLVMLLIAVSLPIATKLVSQNQENRSNATAKCKCSNPAYSSDSTCSMHGGKWTCESTPISTPIKILSSASIPCSSSSCSTCGNPNDCSRVGCSWNGTACLNSSSIDTPTPSCSENSLKCAVTTQYKCINGKWENFKSCPSGCDGSSCIEPTPTQSSCSLTSCSTCGNPNDCSRVGCSWNGTACLNSSSIDTPTPSCSENSLKCAVTTQYKCINGKWENFKSCPSGCDGSSCIEPTPTPIPTSIPCSSSSCSTCGNPNDCSRVGCSWNGNNCLIKNINPTSTPTKTYETCTNNTTKCISGQMYFCNSGSWKTGVKCPSGECSGSVCKETAQLQSSVRYARGVCDGNTGRYACTTSESGTYSNYSDCASTCAVTPTPTLTSCSSSSCSTCATAYFCAKAGGCYWESQVRACTSKPKENLPNPLCDGAMTDSKKCQTAYIFTKCTISGWETDYCDDMQGEYCVNGSCQKISNPIKAGDSCVAGGGFSGLLNCPSNLSCYNSKCITLDELKAITEAKTTCKGTKLGATTYYDSATACPKGFSCNQVTGLCDKPIAAVGSKKTNDFCNSDAECISGSCLAYSNDPSSPKICNKYTPKELAEQYNQQAIEAAAISLLPVGLYGAGTVTTSSLVYGVVDDFSVAATLKIFNFVENNPNLIADLKTAKNLADTYSVLSTAIACAKDPSSELCIKLADNTLTGNLSGQLNSVNTLLNETKITYLATAATTDISTLYSDATSAYKGVKAMYNVSVGTYKSIDNITEIINSITPTKDIGPNYDFSEPSLQSSSQNEF